MSGFYSTNKGKKACEVNRANILCRKIIAEGSVTFQKNLFFIERGGGGGGGGWYEGFFKPVPRI